METRGASSNKSLIREKSGSKWPAWHSSLSEYRKPTTVITVWQLLNTFLPYCGLWILMVLSIQHDYSYAITLPLALIAALFIVRLFILFHDCMHGSLFPNKTANASFGHALGLLVFTPFDDWRFSHLRHHTTYANLDARGFGDIWTMTRTEYEKTGPLKR